MFLDNAPTYMTFIAAEMGSHHLDVSSVADVRILVNHQGAFIIAVSLGSVFFSAGNGPNFMVKFMQTGLPRTQCQSHRPALLHMLLLASSQTPRVTP